jgi:hypothetical protein
MCILVVVVVVVPAETVIRAEVSLVRLAVKLGLFDPAILGVFNRLISNMLWIAALLAVPKIYI